MLKSSKLQEVIFVYIWLGLSQGIELATPCTFLYLQSFVPTICKWSFKTMMWPYAYHTRMLHVIYRETRLLVRVRKFFKFIFFLGGGGNFSNFWKKLCPWKIVFQTFVMKSMTNIILSPFLLVIICKQKKLLWKCIDHLNYLKMGIFSEWHFYSGRHFK